MGETRFFHLIYGGVHELSSNPFPYERDLQDLFQTHLRALTGIDFLASEHSTGQRHSRRIDTLGIDEAGRPVVIEYKRSQDENVINQGLDYLDWLEDHQAEFRELVRDTLGDQREVDFGNPRLLCVANEFPRQDQVAARNSRRRIDLVRYRRYGDGFITLEWVCGGEARPPVRKAVAPKPQPALPDYSEYKNWNKIDEKTRDLFRKLEASMTSLGTVRPDAVKHYISFKCTAAPDNRQPVIAYVRLRIRDGLRVLIYETHVRDIPLEDGFTRLYDRGRMREIIIRDEEHIRKAEPLLRTAYDSLSEHGGSPVRSAAARKAWATRQRGRE